RRARRLAGGLLDRVDARLRARRAGTVRLRGGDDRELTRRIRLDEEVDEVVALRAADGVRLRLLQGGGSGDRELGADEGSVRVLEDRPADGVRPGAGRLPQDEGLRRSDGDGGARRLGRRTDEELAPEARAVRAEALTVDGPAAP